MKLYDRIAKIEVDGFQSPFAFNILDCEGFGIIRVFPGDWVIKYNATLAVIGSEYVGQRYDKLQ